MSDQALDTKTTDQTAQSGGTSSAPTQRPGAAAVHAMLARGQRDPAVIAAWMQNHPAATHEIMALLNQTLGNAFVRTVVDILGGGAVSAATSASGPMRVTAHGLNVRSSPSKHGDDNIVGTLPYHAVVDARSRNGEWVGIEHGGNPAFVFGHYVEPVGKSGAPEAAHHTPHPHHARHAPPAHHDATTTATTTTATTATTTTATTTTPVDGGPHTPIPTPPVHTPVPPTTGTTSPADHAAKPPVADVAPPHVVDATHKAGATDKDKAKDKKKSAPAGVKKYGGGTVKAVLTKLANAGKLKITGNQIAQLDAVAQVETGGQVSGVDTTDDQVVSIGFHQVVLGHKSIEAVMKKVPAAFAKHGLELDMSQKYNFASKPHQIVGAPDYDDLRGQDWAMKFYEASLEPDVIIAIAEYALAEAVVVEGITREAGGTADFFSDDTARAWLLEVHNNRPNYTGPSVEKAIAGGAKSAKDRELFLDILAMAIVDTYEALEPVTMYNKAIANLPKGKQLSTEEQAALMAKMKVKYGPVGRRKGTNITTKMSRHLDIPKLSPVPADAGTDHHDEPVVAHHDAAPVEHHDTPVAHHDEPKPRHAEPPINVTPPVTPRPPITATPPVTADTKGTPPVHHDTIATPPTPVPVTAHADQTHTDAKTTATADAPTGSAEMVSMVLHVDDQYVQIYVSPGGITNNPDIFMFFHGHDANLGIDPTIAAKKGDNASGEDTAGAAMAQAKAKNTIAILPQGVRGGRSDDRTQEGGYMKALKDGKKGALGQFLTDILAMVGPKLHKTGAITPNRISLAGHSAGGYMGIHDALSGAGDLADSITDVTLMDTSYAGVHFADTLKWMYAGKGDKTVRIVQAPNQIDPGKKVDGKWVPNPDKRFYEKYFGEAALGSTAPHHKMSIKPMSAGDERGGNTRVYQHTQVLRPDGTLQCDVMILISNVGHHEVRDNVMDDSMDSIGRGAEGADSYGKNLMTNLGRDGAMPHAGNGAVPKDERGAITGATGTTKADEPAHPKAKVEAVKQTIKQDDPKPDVKHHDEPKHQDKPKDTKAKTGPVGDIQPTHEHKVGHYDRLKGGVDSFGNATDSTRASARGAGDENHVFKNAFQIITDSTTLYTSAEGMEVAPGKLAKGSMLHVARVHESPTPNWKKGMPQFMARAQIVTAEFGLDKNIWINFSNLGGKPEANAVVPFGNELTDAKDKERADAIRAGLPKECKPGQSKYKWRFGANFLPSFHGTALDSGLMSKVNALMNWAIANDMVVGDIVIGEGMRDPRHAHWMSTRFWIARGGMPERMVDRSLFAGLKDGKDADGTLWYKPGWTDKEIIANAEEKYKGGGTGKVAAEGYNFGDSRRAPMKLDSGQGVSAHCSGHAVDVGIPWRDRNNPTSKEPDLWGWEEIYHQFGLTRPLHRDKGGPSNMQEHWHIEETGKQLNLAYEDEKPPVA